MYYLRTKPAVNAIQYTVDQNDDEILQQSDNPSEQLPYQQEEAVCLSCSA